MPETWCYWHFLCMFASSRLIALCTPNCKSLWIKASAKWLNVNVNVNKLKTLYISLIYLHLSYLFISIYMYVVLFTWLFSYKGPEMCQVFRQVSFFNDMMSLRCCLATSQSLHCWSWFRVLIHLPFSGNTRTRRNLRQLNPDILI